MCAFSMKLVDLACLLQSHCMLRAHLTFQVVSFVDISTACRGFFALTFPFDVGFSLDLLILVCLCFSVIYVVVCVYVSALARVFDLIDAVFYSALTDYDLN